MNIPLIQSPIDTSNVPVEQLAGNKHLTKQQKIHEASRQFEAILLRQILSEMQKPVINSEFTDDSTANGIYQDYVSNALADSISKSGSFGLTKVFEQQLSPHSSKNIQSQINIHTHSAAHPGNSSIKNVHSLSAIRP
jgi:Rod binding domain-containing protein